MACEGLPRQRKGGLRHLDAGRRSGRRERAHPRAERLLRLRRQDRRPVPGLRPDQPIPLQREGRAEVREHEPEPGPDGLRSKILRPDPRTMDDSGPAGRQVLQRLAVCVLQQQSGELCGSGWNGSMA